MTSTKTTAATSALKTSGKPATVGTTAANLSVTLTKPIVGATAVISTTTTTKTGVA